MIKFNFSYCLSFVLTKSEHNAFYQIIDALPEMPQRRKSITLAVTDFTLGPSNKRSTGVPSTETGQTLNDEELVIELLKFNFLISAY